MIATVEISKYPLNEKFIGPIKSFIDRLNSHEGIQVKTFATNTLVKGEFDYLMNVLQQEIKESFVQYGKVVFVLKVLNGDLDI